MAAVPLEEVSGITYVKPLRRVERLMESCAEKGARINAMRWMPEGDATKITPKGAILFCHGYGHYLGLIYDFLATQLWHKCGIVSFGIEHYGHGKSEGLSAYIEDFDKLVADVLAYVAHIRANELPPHTPLFAYGESLGGGIALHCALKAPNAFSGLCLFAPMTGVSEGVEPNAAVVAIGRVAAAVFPKLAAAPVKDILEFCFRNKAMLALARADPYRYSGKMRLGTAFQLKAAMEWLSQHGAGLDVPFVLFHGDGDRITSHHASENLFDRCRAQDKTLVTVKDAWHVLWFEEVAIRKQLMDKLCGWLSARCDAANLNGGVGSAKVSLPVSVREKIEGTAEAPKAGAAEATGAAAVGVSASNPDMNIYTLASHPSIYVKGRWDGPDVSRPSEQAVKDVLATAPPRLGLGAAGLAPIAAATGGAGAAAAASPSPLPPVETVAGESSPAHGVVDAVVKSIQSSSTMVVAAEAAAGE